MYVLVAEDEKESIEDIESKIASLEADDVGDSREERVFRMWINSLNLVRRVMVDSLIITNLYCYRLYYFVG